MAFNTTVMMLRLLPKNNPNMLSNQSSMASPPILCLSKVEDCVDIIEEYAFAVATLHAGVFMDEYGYYLVFECVVAGLVVEGE